MNIEDQWFLEGLWRQQKVKKIHFKFQFIARRKNARKRDESCKIQIGGAARSSLVPRPCAPAHEATFFIASCAPGPHSIRPTHEHSQGVLVTSFL